MLQCCSLIKNTPECLRNPLVSRGNRSGVQNDWVGIKQATNQSNAGKIVDKGLIEE